MKDMTFAYPQFFFLFALLPLLIGWYIWRIKKNNPEIRVPTLEPFAISRVTFRQVMRHGLFALRVLALAALIVALARPQSSSSSKKVTTEGIDITIALDISTSMLAEDLKPNRMEAAKKTAQKFIQDRQSDRIGLVAFAAESFTQCPITIDHSVLINLVRELKTGMVEDGTAIGNGLATSVTRLKESKAKSKVIILLTDGDNNAGFIEPMMAAEIAKNYGVRVYTIGVGTRGMAPYPVKTPWGTQYQNIEVKINEDVLKNIANLTGGKFFRATNTKGLENIYDEINKMEQTKIDVHHFSRKSELFLPFALLAAALFAVEIFSRYTWLRTLP